MSPVTRRRAWPVAAAALPVFLLAAAPAVEQGITYDFRLSTTSTQDGKSRDVATMAGRGQVTRSGDARIDLADVKNGGLMASKDAYIIVQGGDRMLMVDPKEKQYFAFNVEQMMAGMSSMMQAVGGMMRMQMSDVKMDVADLGAGETIQGYATRRMRMTQSYTLTMSMLGRKSTTRAADTTDFWLAPDLRHVVNPYLRMGNAAAAMLDFANPEFKTQVQAANAKLAVGLPLKAVTRSVSTDDKGKQTLTTSIMEVTNVRTGDIPASTFAIPAGYTEVAMPYEQLAALGDSAAAARTRGGAEADTSKPSAGEAAKKGAGGLLRRVIKP